MENVLIIGDFNSDTKRSNKFDKLLIEFIRKNKLIDVYDPKKQKIDYIYKSGNNKARIDHILANNNCIRKDISSKILIHELDLSDHRALQVIIHAQTI